MRIKKVMLVGMMMVLMLALTVTSNANLSGEGNVIVYVDENRISFPDQRPYIDVKGGRTLVPVRFPAEAFGAIVDWEQTDKRVDIADKEKGKDIKLWIGKNDYKVNDEVKVMDTVAILKNDRTMVPMRFISEGLGVRVEYDRVEYENKVKTLVYNFTRGQNEAEIESFKKKAVEEVKAELRGENTVKGIDMEKVKEFAKGKGLEVKVSTISDKVFRLMKGKEVIIAADITADKSTLYRVEDYHKDLDTFVEFVGVQENINAEQLKKEIEEYWENTTESKYITVSGRKATLNMNGYKGVLLTVFK